VTVHVVDESGAPLPGLLMNLVSDNPYLQDARSERRDKRAKAAVVVEFRMTVAARVVLTVEDIEGTIRRTLVDGALPAGRHQVAWNGRDDGGLGQYSGRYTFHMTAYDTADGSALFEDAVDALMCRLDPLNDPVAVTDDEGRVVLTDPRLFPHFYDREPMTAYDENGDAMGTLQPTEDMIFTFADTVNGGGGIFREKVERGSEFTFVLKDNSEPAGTLAAGVAGPPRDAAPADVPPGDGDFALGPVFPNPFN